MTSDGLSAEYRTVAETHSHAAEANSGYFQVAVSKFSLLHHFSSYRRSNAPLFAALRDSRRCLSLDHQQWVHPRYTFLFPVKVLARLFRGKFVAGLKRHSGAASFSSPAV